MNNIKYVHTEYKKNYVGLAEVNKIYKLVEKWYNEDMKRK